MANRFISLVFLLALYTLVDSSGRFVGIPKNSSGLKAAIKHSIDLKCEYFGDYGDNDGQFLEWYKDDIPVSSEKPGHYIVKTDKNVTTLTIKIFVKNDSLVKKWYVKTQKYENGVACEFNQIQLKKSPQSIGADDKILDTSHNSVQRKEGGSINFTCNVEPKEGPLVKVKWEYSADDGNYTIVLPEGIVRHRGNNLSIPHVKKMHRGYYRCTLNNISFSVLLRVKDQYAALWPFLGIVGVVTILVLIILIFEKRQKAARKAATTNDEDNTKDPLVRSGHKSSDNDNKKRAVKT